MLAYLDGDRSTRPCRCISSSRSFSNGLELRVGSSSSSVIATDFDGVKEVMSCKSDDDKVVVFDDDDELITPLEKHHKNEYMHTGCSRKHRGSLKTDQMAQFAKWMAIRVEYCLEMKG